MRKEKGWVYATLHGTPTPKQKENTRSKRLATQRMKYKKLTLIFRFLHVLHPVLDLGCDRLETTVAPVFAVAAPGVVVVVPPGVLPLPAPEAETVVLVVDEPPTLLLAAEILPNGIATLGDLVVLLVPPAAVTPTPL